MNTGTHGTPDGKIICDYAPEELAKMKSYLDSSAAFTSNDFRITVQRANARLWIVSRDPLVEPNLKKGADIILGWCFSQETFKNIQG